MHNYFNSSRASLELVPYIKLTQGGYFNFEAGKTE